MHPVDDRMSDRVLSNGDGFIVMFPVAEAEPIRVDNKSITTVRAFFFKVSKSIGYRFRYTQLGSIDSGAGNALDYDYLGDSGHGSGSDILRLENDDFKVYHVGFGLASPNLRVYEEIDPANPNRATDFSNKTEPDPTNGDNFGFYDGKMQDDRFDPPAHTERVSIRNDSNGQFLKFGFFADANVPDGNTDIEVVGKTYELAPVTDADEQEFMLNQMQARRAGKTPDLKTIASQIGGIYPWELGTSLPGGWDDLEDEIARDLQYEPQVPPTSTPGSGSGVGAGRQNAPTNGNTQRVRERMQEQRR